MDKTNMLATTQLCVNRETHVCTHAQFVDVIEQIMIVILSKSILPCKGRMFLFPVFRELTSNKQGESL